MTTGPEQGETTCSDSWTGPAELAPTCPHCEGLSRRVERLERHRSCLKSFLDAAQSIVGEYDMLLAEEKGTIVRYHHLMELIDKLGDIVADYDIWWDEEVESVEKSQEVRDGSEQSGPQPYHMQRDTLGFLFHRTAKQTNLRHKPVY